MIERKIYLTEGEETRILLYKVDRLIIMRKKMHQKESLSSLMKKALEEYLDKHLKLVQATLETYDGPQPAPTEPEPVITDPIRRLERMGYPKAAEMARKLKEAKGIDATS